jgi:RNA polymerase sigma-70 factor (ECF subfamily)
MISDGTFENMLLMENGHSNADSVYAQLRRLAAAYLSEERRGHTLQPTALVNEAIVRLLACGGCGGMETGALIQAAARAMRHVLVDYARRHRAAKRAGGAGSARKDLRDDLRPQPGPDVDIMALDEALTRLGGVDPELLRIVELRFFGGLTEEQTARCLGVSSRTVTRAWRFARVWLARELSPGDST